MLKGDKFQPLKIEVRGRKRIHIRWRLSILSCRPFEFPTIGMKVLNLVLTSHRCHRYRCLSPVSVLLV